MTCTHPCRVMQSTVVPRYCRGRPKAPSRCLKPWGVPNPTSATFPRTYSPFLLWEAALHSFSRAYSNCQCHHYSCTLGPWLSKVRVTWLQAPWYHDGRSDSWNDCEGAAGRAVCSAPRRGQSGDSRSGQDRVGRHMTSSATQNGT